MNDEDFRECEQCNKKNQLDTMILNIVEILDNEVTEKQIDTYEDKNNVDLFGWFCGDCTNTIIKTLEQ